MESNSKQLISVNPPKQHGFPTTSIIIITISCSVAIGIVAVILIKKYKKPKKSRKIIKKVKNDDTIAEEENPESITIN